MKDFYIDVLVVLPLDNLFTYKSNYETKIGSIVKVPFGNNNEIIKAIVISKPYTIKEKFLTKDVISVENYESILSVNQIELLKWSSKYYLVSLPKIFNSIFSKQILNLKIDKLNEANLLMKNKKNQVNLIVDHSRDILNNIIIDIKSNKIEDQKLILSPNTFQTQYSYKILSKTIKNIYIYDSKTSIKDKLTIWKKILKNEKILILGTKSAVFLPFKTLNKIYVIYEHNFLFKETEKVIRYNAKDCAIVLSKVHKCDINLISDSPSIESMYNVKNNKFKFYDKSGKLNLKTDLKKITIYNKFEKKIKNSINGIISKEILEEIKYNYNNKKKTIVFTPYSYDVETLYDSIKNNNRDYNIFSLSKNKKFTRSQLNDFYENINDCDLIIGNYSVIDSLETYNYSLLILIDPDKISSLTNYKSNEVFFQLIFKVIKKVNYDSDKKLILQLINSNPESLKDNIRLDYYKIISKEMNERKLFEYAPYKRLISIEIRSKNKINLESKGKKLFDKLKNKLKFCSPTDIGVVNNKKGYVYKVYLKLDRIKNLTKNKIKIYDLINKIKKRKEFFNNLITIDVDP